MMQLLLERNGCLTWIEEDNEGKAVVELNSRTTVKFSFAHCQQE